MKVENFKPQVVRFVFTDCHGLFVLPQADCSIGLFSLRSFTNSMLAQLDLFKSWNESNYKADVLPLLEGAR